MENNETDDTVTSRSRGRRGASAGPTSSPVPAVHLGPHDILVGTLSVEGDVRIDGRLEGEVRATGEVTVHSTGTVNAQIEAGEVTVRGGVEGDVIAHDRITIAGPGVLKGNVRAARMRIDDGATVDANLAVRPANSAADPTPAFRRQPDAPVAEVQDEGVDTHEETGETDDAELTGTTPSSQEPERPTYAYSYEPPADATPTSPSFDQAANHQTGIAEI